MSVGIKPYLGTGLAEMLAQRGLEERASRMKQQEAMAPGLMQALAPAIQRAGLMGDPSQLMGSVSALQQAGLMPAGQQQGLAAMLAGQPQQGPSQAAQTLFEAAGVNPDVGRFLPYDTLVGLVEKQAQLPIEFAKQEMTGTTEAVKAAQAGNLAAQQIAAQIANVRSLIPDADAGLTAKAFALANKDRLARFFQSPENKALQTSLIELYNQYRQSLGNRLFSSEAPTDLKPEMTLSGEQIAAMMDALERAQLYQTIYANEIAELQQRMRGRIPQSEIVKLQKDVADYIRLRREAK